uniref:Uncharacterized protein n=1 Tax=Brassica oleracea var. oleracea TaxID=109376 RepID=A0A0D3CCG5_BRAOL
MYHFLSPRPASQDSRLNGFSTFQLRRPLLLALKNLLCSSMASMVTAPSPSRSRPPPYPPPSFAVFVVVFGASPLEPPKPPDDSPLAIVQPSTAVYRSFTFTAVCSSAFGVFRKFSVEDWRYLDLCSNQRLSKLVFNHFCICSRLCDC